MSNIAEALAKAKERTGTTSAPFLLPNVARPVAPIKNDAVLRKARIHHGFWVALLSLALVGTAFVIREKLNSVEAYGPGDTAAQTAGVPQENHGTGSPTAVSTPVARDLPATREDLYRTVNELVFTAVLPGEKPRLLYQGRIINIGEAVEGQLVFAGTHDGLIEFTDRRGARYTLRY